jgi:hypothetical protein
MKDVQGLSGFVGAGRPLAGQAAQVRARPPRPQGQGCAGRGGLLPGGRPVWQRRRPPPKNATWLPPPQHCPPQALLPQAHVVRLYANGVFTVDGGPARAIDDPANQEFLDVVTRCVGSWVGQRRGAGRAGGEAAGCPGA